MNSWATRSVTCSKKNLIPYLRTSQVCNTPVPVKLWLSSSQLSLALFWKTKLSSGALKVAPRSVKSRAGGISSHWSTPKTCSNTSKLRHATPPQGPVSPARGCCHFCDQEPTARNERAVTPSLLVNTSRRLEGGPLQNERVTAQMEKDHRISRGEKLQARLCGFGCWFLGLSGFWKEQEIPIHWAHERNCKGLTCTRLRTPVNEAGAAGRGTAANLNAKPTFLTWHSTCCMVAGAVWTQRRASIQNRRNARRKGFEKWKYAG